MAVAVARSARPHVPGDAGREREVLHDERAAAAQQLRGVDDVAAEDLRRRREAEEFPVTNYHAILVKRSTQSQPPQKSERCSKQLVTVGLYVGVWLL